MVKHFIAISSLYSKGFRIAWHYSADKYDQVVVQDFLNRVNKKFGDIQLGVHVINTDSVSWASVENSDSYFKDIIVLKDQEDFISHISRDQSLSALDIAKYILSIGPITHLKLQKLLYFAYADFLVATGEQLFKDKIYAWKHGPVVETVYEHYKAYGAEDIEFEDESKVIIISTELLVPASLTKILTSEHGLLAFDTIGNVVVKYLDSSPWDLVNITHRPGSPWDKVYKPDQNKPISDEMILAYS